MSFQAMTWAVDQKLPCRDKLVLLMLANYASSETGDCFPSVMLLAEQCGLSKSSVLRSIKSLESQGLLSINRSCKNGVNMPNFYSLNLKGVVSHRHQGGVTQTPGVVSHRHHNLSLEPIIEPITSYPLENDSFERFWSAYPKRDGGNPKKPAEQKFKIALRKAGAETIISAATRYAADQRNRYGASPSPYTKQAATWLSQECWTEYQPTPLDNREGLVEDDPWRLRHQLWSKTRAWHVDWGNIHDLPEEWRQRFADALEWDRHPRRE